MARLGCSTQMNTRFVPASEAVALYKKLLPHVVTAGTRNAQYEGAFEIVKAIQELRATQKQYALFGQELADLRTNWRAKRNFMKLLATLG
jgi:hypothetical protein